MKKTLRTIGLFGKFQDRTAAEHVKRLGAYLRGRGHEILLDADTAALVGASFAASRPRTAIGRDIDLAVVIGGDGTMLNVARHLAPHRVPITGVNLGRLGFLVDIPLEVMTEEIGKILDGDYHAESRLLLHAEVVRGGEIAHEASAFNDVIITKGELARLIEFETYLDGEFVNSMRGDGAIVASPTGSTAYALSAGGPILHPTLPAIALVPICPHTLSNRPIVVSSDAVVEVVMTGLAGASAHATFDGQLSFSLRDGDRVRVRRAEAPVELVHPSARSHFGVLREKLHWGHKP